MEKNTTSSSMKVIALLCLLALPAVAITILRNDGIPSYPDEIQFRLSARGEDQIDSIELEFGTDVLTCGQSINRAIPEDFTPGTSIETEWTWNLRRTGPMPPGTMVWWRWILRDSTGDEVETPVQSLEFTDTLYPWKLLETESLMVYWYIGDQDFARKLANAGEGALQDLRKLTGVQLDEKVRIYVYANPEEMQSATLFAPDWSGGMAFPDFNTVLTAIDPSQLEWGRRVVSHELAHVVIGRYTFSCIETVPIWLDEGIAMKTEGEQREYYAVLLQEAIEEDTLQSVRELGEIFSNDPERASLAYAQSYSLVSFIFEQYGQEKLLSLLDAFRDGTPEDQALEEVYGLDRDGLEAAWRESIGAAPMKATPATGAKPTHTPYPTFAPITGPEFSQSETPTVETMALVEPSPMMTPTQVPTDLKGSRPSNTTLILIAGGAGVVVMMIAAWVLIRRRRRL
jgi:hypothetical protein